MGEFPRCIYFYGKQGNIEVILARNDGEWDRTTHTTSACVGDFSKERLQEIATKLQEFVDSI